MTLSVDKGGASRHGWTKVLLENHVYIAARIGWRGLKRSEYRVEGPNFLSVRNIRPDGSVDLSRTDHISEARYRESPEIQLRSGDILLTKDGNGIGKIGMIAELPEKTTVNSSLLVVRPDKRLILPRFLFHFFRGPFFQSVVQARIRGSAVPHVFQRDIRKLEIQVPPIDEQERIVVKLEELLDKVDACQRRLDSISVSIKRFRRSVLKAACSGSLTYSTGFSEGLPRGWQFVKLGTLFRVATGATPDRKNPRYFEGGKTPWVRTADVQNEDIREVEGRITDLALQETNAKIFPPNTLLVAMYGEGRTRGQVARLCVPAATNQACAALVNETMDEVTRQYILYCLLGNYHKLRAAAVGGNQPNLSLGIIREWTIPLPPKGERQEIVRSVATLMRVADRLELRCDAAQANVDRLAQAILAKAFRGELVRQNPQDEPASELIERIRAKEVRALMGART